VKYGRVVVTAIGVLLVLGATTWVLRYRMEQPGSSRREDNHGESSTGSGSSVDDRSGNRVLALLKGPVGAWVEMLGTQEEHGDTGTQAVIDDTPTGPPVEPSIFNVDAVAMGPHAYEITVDKGFLDPLEEEEQTDSDSTSQAPGSAVSALSKNAANNEQILQGKATTEDPTIGPKEVDPETHPPTD